jgi:hypothetical protein
MVTRRASYEYQGGVSHWLAVLVIDVKYSCHAFRSIARSRIVRRIFSNKDVHEDVVDIGT